MLARKKVSRIRYWMNRGYHSHTRCGLSYTRAKVIANMLRETGRWKARTVLCAPGETWSVMKKRR